MFFLVFLLFRGKVLIFLNLKPLNRINVVLYYVTYYVLYCIKAISKVNVILEVSCILVLT